MIASNRRARSALSGRVSLPMLLTLTIAISSVSSARTLAANEHSRATKARDEAEAERPAFARSYEVALSGPGSVRILQYGGTAVIAMPGKAAPNQPAPGKNAGQGQEMKLTYIQFEKQMKASSLTYAASFSDAVRVLHFPCKDPHCEIDLDEILSKELPEGAVYLRCDQLRVGIYQKPVNAANPEQLRTYPVMDARGHIYVQGREFTVQCDHLTFNEEKDQVILIGEGDNKVVLSKGIIKGRMPQTLRAKKITYIRSTGEIEVDGIGSINGQ